MQKINKKQKIAFITAVIILIIGISYYIYAGGKESDIDFSDLENIEGVENTEKQIGEEKQNKIKVHISGAVYNPGVVELEENSRVGDAIEKAGGLTQEASVDEINLASILEDGSKIHILTKEEIQQAKLTENGESEESGETTTSSTGKSTGSTVGTSVATGGAGVSGGNSGTSGSSINFSASSNSKTTSKININTATQAELETLPGIGPATATKIISYRQENGKFKSIDEIKEVKGIGDSKYSKIKDLIKI